MPPSLRNWRALCFRRITALNKNLGLIYMYRPLRSWLWLTVLVALLGGCGGGGGGGDSESAPEGTTPPAPPTQPVEDEPKLISEAEKREAIYGTSKTGPNVGDLPIPDESIIDAVLPAYLTAGLAVNLIDHFSVAQTLAVEYAPTVLEAHGEAPARSAVDQPYNSYETACPLAGSIEILEWVDRDGDGELTAAAPAKNGEKVLLETKECQFKQGVPPSSKIISFSPDIGVTQLSFGQYTDDPHSIISLMYEVRGPNHFWLTNSLAITDAVGNYMHTYGPVSSYWIGFGAGMVWLRGKDAEFRPTETPFSIDWQRHNSTDWGMVIHSFSVVRVYSVLDSEGYAVPEVGSGFVLNSHGIQLSQDESGAWLATGHFSVADEETGVKYSYFAYHDKNFIYAEADDNKDGVPDRSGLIHRGLVFAPLGFWHSDTPAQF